MRFIWQSWGDHTDIALAAVVYFILIFVIFIHCQFGEELSQQVSIVWVIQRDYIDCFLRVYYKYSIHERDVCFLELQ
jgi:hypothetical protein